MIGINKRLFMLSLLLIFFTVITSASAVSDISNDSQNLSDVSSNLNNLASDVNVVDSVENIGSDLDLSEENANTDLSDDKGNNIIDSGKNKQLVLENDDNSNADDNSVNSLDMLPQYIKVNDSKYFDNTIIQKIIDNANPGSTIEFTGSFYKNLHLKISKPLNIISKCGTVINTSLDIPVFTISRGGSNTNISGFTINAAGTFVDARDVSNISVMKNKISTKKTAIFFQNVLFSNIQNNLFSSFKTAISLYKSRGILISKNNITPDTGHNVGIDIEECSGSGGIRIYDNRIIGIRYDSFSTGIQIGAGVSNVLIKRNTITDWRIGVHFLDSIKNINIHNNTISNNGDGLALEKGTMDRLNFTKNVLSANMNTGFLFEDDFEGAIGDFVFENNFFSKTGGMAIQSKGHHGFDIGRNFLNGDRLCVKIGMKNTFTIKFRKSGNQLFASVLGGSGWARDLPDFTATLTINGKSYSLLFKNGISYVELADDAQASDSPNSLAVGDETRSISDWGEVQDMSLEEISPYIQEYLDSLKVPQKHQDADDYEEDYYDEFEDYNNQQSQNNSSYNGHNSNSNFGSGDSGLSNGSSSISSSSSSSSAANTAGASASASASSAVPSSPSAPEESATMKTLSVDDETFRVVGVSGLVLLIILVIGLYYREDILEMMKD